MAVADIAIALEHVTDNEALADIASVPGAKGKKDSPGCFEHYEYELSACLGLVACFYDYW